MKNEGDNTKHFIFEEAELQTILHEINILVQKRMIEMLNVAFKRSNFWKHDATRIDWQADGKPKNDLRNHASKIATAAKPDRFSMKVMLCVCWDLKDLNLVKPLIHIATDIRLLI